MDYEQERRASTPIGAPFLVWRTIAHTLHRIRGVSFDPWICIAIVDPGSALLVMLRSFLGHALLRACRI